VAGGMGETGIYEIKYSVDTNLWQLADAIMSNRAKNI
jgi:hypothetical protein